MIEGARDIVLLLILLFDNILRVNFSRSLLAARCGNLGAWQEKKKSNYTIVPAPLP